MWGEPELCNVWSSAAVVQADEQAMRQEAQLHSRYGRVDGIANVHTRIALCIYAHRCTSECTHTHGTGTFLHTYSNMQMSFAQQ